MNVLNNLTSATFEVRTSEFEPSAEAKHTTSVREITDTLIAAKVDFTVKQMNPADTLVTHVLVGHDMVGE